MEKQATTPIETKNNAVLKFSDLPYYDAFILWYREHDFSIKYEELYADEVSYILSQIEQIYEKHRCEELKCIMGEEDIVSHGISLCFDSEQHRLPVHIGDMVPALGAYYILAHFDAAKDWKSKDMLYDCICVFMHKIGQDHVWTNAMDKMRNLIGNDDKLYISMQKRRIADLEEKLQFRTERFQEEKERNEKLSNELRKLKEENEKYSDSNDWAIEMVKRDTCKLINEGNKGKDILVPYIAAFELNLVPAMNKGKFESTFNVNLDKNIATIWLHSYTKPGKTATSREFEEEQLRSWLEKYNKEKERHCKL